MGLIAADDGWKIPDELWEKIELLLPPGKPHLDLVRAALEGLVGVITVHAPLDALAARRSNDAIRTFLREVAPVE